MYDTVNLWLPIDRLGDFDSLKVSPYLSDVTEHRKGDGRIYLSGTLNNYRVSMSKQGVSLKGSIAKYFLSDNIQTLTRLDFIEAIEKMSDELCLPINQAVVRRIDFGQNFIMNYNLRAYYNYLGQCQFYRRQSVQSESLYYSNKLRGKVFYDKIAESKNKGICLPDVWNGQNVLRYEIRFEKRLSEQFNLPEVTVDTLSNQKFYMNLFDKWHEEYESIDKLNAINFNLSNISSPKDFWKQMNLVTINTIGQDRIMQEIETLKAKNIFDKQEYYSRLKKEVKTLHKQPKMTCRSDLIAELDKKIRNAKKYYR